MLAKSASVPVVVVVVVWIDVGLPRRRTFNGCADAGTPKYAENL
jgi:hypothetical protein